MIWKVRACSFRLPWWCCQLFACCFFSKNLLKFLDKKLWWSLDLTFLDFILSRLLYMSVKCLRKLSQTKFQDTRPYLHIQGTAWNYFHAIIHARLLDVREVGKNVVKHDRLLKAPSSSHFRKDMCFYYFCKKFHQHANEICINDYG